MFILRPLSPSVSAGYIRLTNMLSTRLHSFGVRTFGRQNESRWFRILRPRGADI